MNIWTKVDTTAVTTGMTIGAGMTVLGSEVGLPVLAYGLISSLLAVGTCLSVYVIAGK